MKKLDQLTGRRRRRHRRLLRAIKAGPLFLRHEHAFRMAERLHRAGLIVCVASRVNWRHGQTSRIHKHRVYRELACFASKAEALRRYPHFLQMEGHATWR